MLLKVEMSLPAAIVKTLGLTESETALAIKKEMAAYFFQRHLLSFGQARLLAELSIWDFLDFLKVRKVPLHYDLSEYEEDSKTVQEFL
ncbi:MAG: UPF0175 family protein [Deltaproteobacteria bacterium]|nr:UPF0175 family protein [Deltaproteobacteria bacterium]